MPADPWFDQAVSLSPTVATMAGGLKDSSQDRENKLGRLLESTTITNDLTEGYGQYQVCMAALEAAGAHDSNLAVFGRRVMERLEDDRPSHDKFVHPRTTRQVGEQIAKAALREVPENSMGAFFLQTALDEAQRYGELGNSAGAYTSLRDGFIAVGAVKIDISSLHGRMGA